MPFSISKQTHTCSQVTLVIQVLGLVYNINVHIPIPADSETCSKWASTYCARCVAKAWKILFRRKMNSRTCRTWKMSIFLRFMRGTCSELFLGRNQRIFIPQSYETVLGCGNSGIITSLAQNLFMTWTNCDSQCQNQHKTVERSFPRVRNAVNF